MKIFQITGVLILLLQGFVIADQFDAELRLALDNAGPDEVVSAIVLLDEQVDLEAIDQQLKIQRSNLQVRHETVIRALQDCARGCQVDLVSYLEQLKNDGANVEYRSLWIVNAIVVQADRDSLEKIARRGNVQRLYLDYTIELIDPVDVADRAKNVAAGNDSGGTAAGGPVEPGVAAIRAPEVWDLGITGQGVLVSSLDTGVNGNHPALQSRWAGNQAAYQGNPEWAWFDPVTNTSFPQLFFGNIHGTHTMGSICGGAPGDQIGVAPGASWIHAAVIDRVSLNQTVSDAMLAFQWIADPDQNAATNFDVPAVCGNSWGLATFHGSPPCDDEFWQFLDACEMAGVVIVFAAGNEGFQGVRRPGDRATDDFRTLAVAAVNGNNASFPIAGFSSRGPTFCTPNGAVAIKPDIAAPGVDVRSAATGSGYTFLSGTSMACPHIVGVVALIKQANPNLTVQEIKQVMFETAVDLGSAGEDNNYGWGIVDAFEAVQLAMEMGVLLGDVNRDGLVNLLDVGGFVDLLAVGGYQAEADMDQNGEFNLLDVTPFVDLLAGN